jgi:archaemetzincin
MQIRIYRKRNLFMKAVYILYSVLLLSACHGQSTENKKTATQVEARHTSTEKVKTPNLILVRYSDFPRSLAEEVKAMLSPHFSEISIRNEALPDSAYYQPRNRYLSKVLLNQLLTLRKPNALVLGLTVKDISEAVHGYDNFGIMGEASFGRRVAVVSTWRLGKVQNLKKQDFKKLMLHELAHSVGLKHCSTDNCILHAAEKKNRFATSPSFCEDCREKLTGKGWNELR